MTKTEAFSVDAAENFELASVWASRKVRFEGITYYLAIMISRAEQKYNFLIDSYLNAFMGYSPNRLHSNEIYVFLFQRKHSIENIKTQHFNYLYILTYSNENYTI